MNKLKNKMSVNQVVIVDINRHFYRDADGNGQGWPISRVVNDEAAHFRITRNIPGKRCPIHLAGKYGPLGWVSPDVIITVIG